MPDIGTQKTKKRYQYCTCDRKASTCKGTCLCSKRNKSPASTTLETIMNNVINTAAEKRKALSYWTLEDLVCKAIKIGDNRNVASPKRNTSPTLITFEDTMSNSINTTTDKLNDLTCWTDEDEASTIGENRTAASPKRNKSPTLIAFEDTTSNSINTTTDKLNDLTCWIDEDEASTTEETKKADIIDEIPIANRVTSSVKSLIDRIKDITVRTFDMISMVGRTSYVNATIDQVTSAKATNNEHKHLANEKYVSSYLKNAVRKALHICSKHDKAVCTDAGRHIVWRAACIGAKKDQVICASLLNKTVDKAARIGDNRYKRFIKIDKTTNTVEANLEKVKGVCSNAAKLVVSKAIYFGAERVTGICASLIRDMEEEAVNNCTRKRIMWKTALSRPDKSSYKPIRSLYLSKEKLEAVDKSIIISDHSLKQLVCVATCISQDTAITGASKNLVDNTINSSVGKDAAACLEAVDNATNAAVDICVQTCKGSCSNVIKNLADEAVNICAQNECCLEEVEDVEDQGCTCDESNFAPPEEPKKVVCPATGGECPFKPNRNSNILPVEEVIDETVEEEEPICPCPKKGPKKTVPTKIEQKSVVNAPGGTVICPATGGICPFKPKPKPSVDDTEDYTSCHCSESDDTEDSNSTQSCESTCPNRAKEGNGPKKLNKKIKKVKTRRQRNASVGTCPTTGGVCPYINRLRKFKFQSKGDEMCPPTCTARKQPNTEVEKEVRMDNSCQCSEVSLNVSRKICDACPEPCGEFCPDD